MSKTSEYEIRKIYWKVGDVALKYNMSASKIRFWDEFFNIATSRTSRGDRVFVEKDLEKFNTLYLLVEKLGFTLSGAAKVQSILEDSKSLDSQHMYRIVKEMEHMISKKELVKIEETLKHNP